MDLERCLYYSVLQRLFGFLKNRPPITRYLIIKRTMKEANLFELWCQANAKEISVSVFEKKSGEKFNDFFVKNRRYCLARWKMRMGKKIDKVKKAKETPQYILWKEQKLKDRLEKIKQLKKELLKI